MKTLKNVFCSSFLFVFSVENQQIASIFDDSIRTILLQRERIDKRENFKRRKIYVKF